jgi:hypothetical protein
MSETTENLVRKARRGGTKDLSVSSTTPAPQE